MFKRRKLIYFEDCVDFTFLLCTVYPFIPSHIKLGIINFLAAKRMRWFGHVVRMPEGRMPGYLGFADLKRIIIEVTFIVIC